APRSLVCSLFHCSPARRHLHSFPTRRSSDLAPTDPFKPGEKSLDYSLQLAAGLEFFDTWKQTNFDNNLQPLHHLVQPAELQPIRSEEHTSELQSPDHLVCRLLLEKKKNNKNN